MHPLDFEEQSGGEAGLASLDRQELTVPPADNPSLGGMEATRDLDVAFRHSGWASDRERVVRAFEASAAPDSRISRFRSCGSDAWLQRSVEHPDRIRIRACYCHDRFCIPCAGHHGRLTANRIAAWLDGAPALFLTLTLARDAEPLAARLDRLFSSFRRLRRSRWWRDRVSGGVATIEVKWSLTSEHWHPHLHILCRGSYLDQVELAKAWHNITGDSYIVHVAFVHEPREAAHYLAKYIAKPANAATYRNHDRLCEMIAAMSGRRLLLPFGDCKLALPNLDEGPDSWETIGRLSDIIWRANQGVPEDLAIMAALQGVTTCPTNPQLFLSG